MTSDVSAIDARLSLSPEKVEETNDVVLNCQYNVINSNNLTVYYIYSNSYAREHIWKLSTSSGSNTNMAQGDYIGRVTQSTADVIQQWAQHHTEECVIGR